MGKVIRYIVSLTIFAICAYSIWDYPYAAPLIAIFILILCSLLYKNRLIWLFLIPALLPISDLTLYSGRLVLSEFDIIMMAILAMLILQGFAPSPKEKKVLNIRLSTVAIGMMALSYIISSIINLTYPTGINTNDYSIYYSPDNTYRVAKGFLWALVFWPFLMRQYNNNPEKTKIYFIAGLVTGLLLAGIAALWERGVLDSIVHWRGAYYAIRTLLDFTTSYRVTGLFSSMHVGGTAIDGYLIMTIPFSLYALLSNRTILFQTITVTSLLLGIYAIMVTFSRGLYGGFFVVITILIITLSSQYFIRENIHRRKLIGQSLSIIMVTFYMVFLFLHGGYGAITGGTFLLLATTAVVPFLKRGKKTLTPVLLITIFMLGSYMVFDSLVESKWSDNSKLFSQMIAILTSGILISAGYFLGRSFSSNEGFHEPDVKKIIFFSLFTSIVWLAIIPPLMNARMGVRFASSDADLTHRVQNWKNALNFREQGLFHTIFGTGVGSFPRYYFFNNINVENKVRYHFGQEKNVTFLALGYGDFSMAQKISIEPNRNYTLRAKTRGKQKTYSLSVKLCRKHIIFSDRYTPKCISQRLNGKAGRDWQQHEITFNSEEIGEGGFANWPVTLLLYTTERSKLIEVTDLELWNIQGENLISNGDFSHKSDRWIMIRDFSHDAWHAKNIFIHIIFEQGYFGLVIFVFLILMALRKQNRAMKYNDPLAPLLIAAIIGTLVVGLFGTIIDNPRVTTLYFLLIFLGLLNTPEETNRTD